MASSNETLKYRVGEVEKKLDKFEERMEKLECKLDKIMTNHLPHIELALMQMKTKQNVTTAINVGTIIVALIIQRLIFP